jgi:hypothetical protein
MVEIFEMLEESQTWGTPTPRKEETYQFVAF